MEKLYLLDDAIISPLGFSTEENMHQLRMGNSGLSIQKPKKPEAKPICAGIIEDAKIDREFAKIGKLEEFTKLEKMAILAIHSVLKRNRSLDFSNTPLIIATTKGNIDLLQTSKGFDKNRIYLSEFSRQISNFFGFKQPPITISNACISGGLALVAAKRLAAVRKFENAIVLGADLVSDFVVSGFNSFQALSSEPSKPFSKAREGINLGEAAAAMLVSTKKPKRKSSVSLIGEASVNDANHISGPSRTGEGLFRSMQKSIKMAGISSKKIDFISAHGTGTKYNDEMEAIAFNRAGLEQVPVNSIKAFYGHTLGASALLESILNKHNMLNNEVFASANFEELGVSKPLNIITENTDIELKYALKTASGFGGCNLAMVFQKEEL
ncbi:3-oxoacyl-[acyl-carrier-protein] synthase-1 [Salegentibacter echinorum]|uniref:3-oxoacyl-[acyl-carrier-protein] synthase-1 n=1 Tax=Salegentibacter echinorum TaxID=1073325 RepID=A0A1M5FTB7_SALEC|nr:beta-ketoacyl synthase N-terminal-like domain-containing protein [Salegentibacter echinorum]SHF94790.1 3-oxoacyl-[acyl-carrier-protein] synthase-1 [Salegentibacter echinorum]